MTNAERILAYLARIAPRSASNTEIVRFTQIQPHQQVFQVTKRLVDEGKLSAGKDGNEWRFRLKESDEPHAPLQSEFRTPLIFQPLDSFVELAREFERKAGTAMAHHFGVPLQQGEVGRVPKRFDFISPDRTIVGDAKYMSLVHGIADPPAKFSIIAEHVWLLERTNAAHQFLVFGNDRRVPTRWLERYGALRDRTEFFFLDSDSRLTHLG
jgi:hypothetical protein